jgi:hypothetical protein
VYSVILHKVKIPSSVAILDSYNVRRSTVGTPLYFRVYMIRKDDSRAVEDSIKDLLHLITIDLVVSIDVRMQVSTTRSKLQSEISSKKDGSFRFPAWGKVASLFGLCRISHP